MTYLRMGPTIYEVLEEHELYRKVTAKNRLSQYRIYKENGREQIPSDDITKLFDVYVAHRNGHYGIVGETEAKEIVNTDSGEIYGAIWTDKCLAYAVQLTKEGWVLL